MSLTDHIITDRLAELEQLLRRQDYPLFVKKLKTSSGEYCFRVHDPNNRVLARSRDFTAKSERDTAYESFIDFIEIEIHNRRQRRLFF
jgi:uncharacterized protein YegP (UPF0339 family)